MYSSYRVITGTERVIAIACAESRLSEIA